ncbi:MAG: hypothetical protein ABR540_08615 [Acidimicrobiales bacterium]
MKKAKIQAQRDGLAADLTATEGDLSVAARQVAALQSVMCWYADPAHYDEANGIDLDGGERARRALGRTAGLVGDG